jgi:uncharacterized protein YjbI with pentapeptide repeats
MSDCQFTAEYFDYENNKNTPFRCREVALDTGFCMFHDEIYYTKNKQEVLQCFMDKLKKAIDNNEVLCCVGYNIPEDVHLTNKRFSRPVYFSKARFYGKVYFTDSHFHKEVYFKDAIFYDKVHFGAVNFHQEANFTEANFQEANFRQAIFHHKAYFFEARFKEAYFIDVNFQEANFTEANFQEVYFREAKFHSKTYFLEARFKEADFTKAEFGDDTTFESVVFEDQEKILFGVEELSKVSFINTDITRVRVGEVVWGKGKDNRYKVIDEERFEEYFEKFPGQVTLGDVKTIYRNLRENYEFRLRYEEAGRFFVREMELKRNYREFNSEGNYKIKRNGWFRRNVSLAGLYYHLSRYGESLFRPAVLGIMIVSLSILYWSMQSNPSTLQPSFIYDGVSQLGNSTHLGKALERSVADSFPFLSLGSAVVLQDYIIKSLSILSFGLLAIALRRKYERKFRH